MAAAKASSNGMVLFVFVVPSNGFDWHLIEAPGNGMVLIEQHCIGSA
jgi:hypothetical protein